MNLKQKFEHVLVCFTLFTTKFKNKSIQAIIRTKISYEIFVNSNQNKNQ